MEKEDILQLQIYFIYTVYFITVLCQYQYIANTNILYNEFLQKAMYKKIFNLKLTNKYEKREETFNF